MKISRWAALSAASFLALADSAWSVQFVDYTGTMGGTTANYQWTDFVLPPGVSPGTAGTAGQWAGTATPTNNWIPANGGSATNQFYVPTTGTGTAQFPTEITDFVGGGIYSFFSPTHLKVSSTAPLANMESLILQLSVAAGFTGAFGGAAVDLLSGPTLRLVLSDTSIVNLAANYSLVEASGPYIVPGLGFSTTLDLVGYQWDLSSVLLPIASYSVDFQLGYHGLLFGADTTASTVAHPENMLTALNVPETGPGIFVLGAALLGTMVVGRSRRQLALNS